MSKIIRLKYSFYSLRKENFQSDTVPALFMQRLTRYGSYSGYYWVSLFTLLSTLWQKSDTKSAGEREHSPVADRRGSIDRRSRRPPGMNIKTNFSNIGLLAEHPSARSAIRSFSPQQRRNKPPIDDPSMFLDYFNVPWISVPRREKTYRCP